MTLKIYLVEDNALIRQNLSESLEELTDAQMVGAAATEADACDWLQRYPGEWDLAVVDLFLRQGNGLGVVSCCAQRGHRQKLVVLTNYATDQVRERCLSLGADAVFDKSNELDEFTAYVRDLSGQSQGAQAA